MTRLKYLLIPTMATSLLLLAGCTAQTATNTNTTNDNANVEVVTNTNATVRNENTNAEQGSEVDTTNWLTYTNEEYGFSFRYPEEWTVEPISNVEFYLTNTSDDTIKFYLQPFKDAPEKQREAYALLSTKPELRTLKEELTNEPDATVNGIPFSLSINYDVPGADFYKLATFFIEDDYVRISSPIHIENIEYPDQPYNGEVRVWSESVVGQLNDGQLLSKEQQDFINIFDAIVRTIEVI